MKNKIGLKKLMTAGIGLLTLATFVGSISGSLAWWAYSTRVSVSYQGTSVSTSEQLQIGLKLDVTKFNTDEKVESLGLEEDTSLATENYRYVFARAGSGMQADVISKYLQVQGQYAINELSPITSGVYVNKQTLQLKESLIAGQQNNATEASKKKYVNLPFVFRVAKANSTGEPEYAANSKIFLSGIVADASSVNADAEVQKALRIYFNDGTEDSRFILNVGSESTTVAENYTPVAGALDLNKDGLYDFYTSGSSEDKEIIYGTYEVSGSENLFDQDDAPEALVDLNNTGASAETLADLSKFTTFLAAHGQGKECYANYSGLTFGTAQFKTLNQIKPDDSNAVLNGGTALCTTSASGAHLAELETTIWLEGWDHNVVDSEKNHQFNLGLQFQIDLL